MREIIENKEKQDVLFDALCYFDDFCNRFKLKYYISNGTLLGAAKYGDFIPWDDDVDVMMPREDYEKLVSLSEINCPRFRLLCGTQTPSWRMPYAKLSCENTLVKEGDYDFGEAFGLSVDIFPIDRWSAHSLLAKWQAFVSEIRKRLLVCSIGGDFVTKQKGVKRLILKLISTKGKKIGHKKCLEKILKSVEKSKKRKKKHAGCISWTCHAHKEVFKAELFEETAYLTFRNRKFPVFTRYEKYLTNLYGDWRSELPPEQQHSNHDIKAWWKDV